MQLIKICCNYVFKLFMILKKTRLNFLVDYEIVFAPGTASVAICLGIEIFKNY